MSANEVQARKAGNDHTVTISYDFGGNLDEAVQMFGPEVVHSKFVQAARVDLQAAMRRAMFDTTESGEDVPVDSGEVARRLADWKPGVAQRTGVSSKERALAAMRRMSPEELQELLAELEAAD